MNKLNNKLLLFAIFSIILVLAFSACNENNRSEVSMSESGKQAWEYYEEAGIKNHVELYNNFHNTVLDYETLTDEEREFLRDNTVEDIMDFKAILPNAY